MSDSNRLSILLLCLMLCGQRLLPQRATVAAAGAGTKYMFCIGINNYLANTNRASCKVCDDRGLKNLNGCLNDVDTISRLFIKYYDFNPINVHVLKDGQASRSAITDSLQWLLNKCKKGDYLVFFYSGHGSYEYEKAGDNQTRTGKGYRNTILPADVAQPGIRDFNSAELNKIFSGFTDKGVVLTVITDCCHSATNTRGSTLFEVDSAREVKPSAEIPHGIDVVNGTTRQLDQSGALTIGSCQDNEIASEAQVLPGKFYGAFTISLCRAVTEWSHAPVEILLERTISRLRLLNKIQTPNMEAARRRGMNLPGSARAQAGKTNFPLSCLYCSANGKPMIPAGFTDDIFNGDLLVDTRSKDSIRVSNVGLATTEVQVINQSEKLKAQDVTSLQFVVLKRLPNPDPPLRIFLGNTVSRGTYDHILIKARALLQQKNIHYTWVYPTNGVMPEAVLFYRNGWKLNRNKVMETVALDEPEVAQINALMDAANIKNAWLQLPAPEDLVKQLQEKLSTARNRNILVTDAAAAADFTLAGHLSNAGSNDAEFGWEKTIQGSNKNTDAKKAGLPGLTDFFSVSAGGIYPVDSLTDRIKRLSVLANWLSMKSPPADKSIVFPYHLAVKNTGSKSKADENTSGSSSTEDKLDIGIEKDAGSKLPADSVKPMFVYVMSMDPKGNTYLIYPQPRTSILTYPNAILRDTAFYHLATVRHTTPGSYHYFFIALREAVSSRDIFTRHGVLKGDQAGLSDNPLEALLNDEGTEQRGDIKSFDHWMLKTVEISTETGKVKK